MTLIKSISGIRGTIGGAPGDNLTPVDTVKFASAFATWLKAKHNKASLTVVLGRDARISGPMVSQLVSATLTGMSVHVIDLGHASTPTTEMAVVDYKADGGIILTASHNPGQWNALKLLNEKGEFISAADGAQLLSLVDAEEYEYAPFDQLGSYRTDNFDDRHIQKVLELDLVDVDAIRAAGFKVAIDCVNSVGGIILPKLLKALGVNEVIEMYCEPSGHFPHNPEPLPENLSEISQKVVAENCHVGFVVDPDVDRLAIVCEDGSMFGEEYTLVAVADYILASTPGNTVSNLSSTRALRDITLRYNQEYMASAVGEVNVVEMMKKTHAVIGGEGNGGIIYPELHYGRDALVGIALFLTYLAKTSKTCSGLRKTYPGYVMSKNKIELTPSTNIDVLLEEIKRLYSSEKLNDVDGVKIDFSDGWVHLRKSNTEPIIRVYAEGLDEKRANELAEKVIKSVHQIVK